MVESLTLLFCHRKKRENLSKRQVRNRNCTYRFVHHPAIAQINQKSNADVGQIFSAQGSVEMLVGELFHMDLTMVMVVERMQTVFLKRVKLTPRRPSALGL